MSCDTITFGSLIPRKICNKKRGTSGWWTKSGTESQTWSPGEMDGCTLQQYPTTFHHPDQLNPFTPKAWVKRRTSHASNRMQISKTHCFRSFAFDSTHVKYDVWPMPKSDQCQISPAASSEILPHSMENLAFHSLLTGERWLYYKSSLPHLYIFFL